MYIDEYSRHIFEVVKYPSWVRRDILVRYRLNLKFQTNFQTRHLVQSKQTPHCWALRRWTEQGIQRKAEEWRGIKKFNSDNSDFWANLKGSLQIEFWLCYVNVYLDMLEIRALLWIWFSALQKQAKLEFSKIELSFTKMHFFAFQGVFFQDFTMKQNSTENNVQLDCGNLLIQ